MTDEERYINSRQPAWREEEASSGSLHPVVKPAWFRCWNEKGYGYTARAYDAKGNRIGETHWSEPPYRKRHEAITALKQRLNAAMSDCAGGKHKS